MAMSDTCAACGAVASGRFCDQCGAALDATCAACAHPLPRGARFCNHCGAAAAASATPAGARGRVPLLPWAIATAAIAGVVFLLATRGKTSEPQVIPQGPLAPAPEAGTGGPAAVDLASMSPREAADRLFNRVMTAVSRGDTAQAEQFLPMAVGAYQRVDSLDADGRYHVAALHLVGRDFAGARAQADTILAANPTHLFGLFTAGQAAGAAGDSAAARGFFRRFLQAYDAELAKRLPEYEEHGQGLPVMKDEAQRAVR
jgi:hypothetical protein